MGPILFEDLGLKPAKGFDQLSKDKAYELISQEVLPDYDADAIFVVVNRDDGAQKLYQQIQSSPIWQGLKAVKANHVYAIPDQPWLDYSALGSKMALDDAEKNVCEVTRSLSGFFRVARTALYAIKASGRCCTPSDILLRSHTDGGFEIFDKMRLVVIAEIHRQLRPVVVWMKIHRFCRILEPVKLNDPFRADSDILIEEALQRSFVKTERGTNVIYFSHIPFFDDPVDDLINQRDMGILIRKFRPNKTLGMFDHLGFIFLRKNGAL